MGVSHDRADYRAEFENIIASGFFAPDSNPARFLQYVCSKFFEGNETVSEYDIAVNALGRRPDFDPQRDAIVRVEAHRVRKRLSKFYETEGADRTWHLVIPQGGYLPVFIRTGHQAEAPSASEASSGASATRGTPRFRRPIVLLAGIIVVALGTTVLLVSKARKPTHAAVGVAAPTNITVPMSEVRIMAGATGNNYTDRLGRVWSADRFFEGGSAFRQRYRKILRTTDPLLFLTSRMGSEFGYNIPLQPGLYEMRLYFAETFFGEDNPEGGGESSRSFIVLANGVRILPIFDPLADAGGNNTADVRVFKGVAPTEDGRLHLQFKARLSSKGVPFVNAIELIRTNSRAMLPIRWVASATAAMDSHHVIWQPDQFFSGGRLRSDEETVSGTDDPDLYRSERFGYFSYAVPVAEGSYTLTLHFAEHWFGIAGREAVGRVRRFDVFCNGVALLREFRIDSEVGSMKALKKTFHGLKPNAQGKLMLTFVPIYDYATVDALEVLDEGAQ